ncbi:hypothetical protein MNBD_PLANCTO02-2686 [hydrothermal vent metagenome]|uniref:Uncharacterized protein n=1 Tax=hydrothermal vent metagenome TaxID=652676 RepID=A0A3B1DJA4_9ZZZZ
MSRLRLYHPPRNVIPFASSHSDDKPEVYSYTDYVKTGLSFKGHRELNVLDRARTLHINRFCPECGYPDVEPLELDDAIINRNSLPIPGTATLVGFHCNDCHTEWSGETA